MEYIPHKNSVNNALPSYCHSQSSAYVYILLLQFRQQCIAGLFRISKQHGSVRVVEDGVVYRRISNTQRPLHHYYLHQSHISDCARNYLNALSYNRSYLIFKYTSNLTIFYYVRSIKSVNTLINFCFKGLDEPEAHSKGSSFNPVTYTSLYL